ncbi:MAG: MBL fold metallo-hydrolase [Spirochaetota bacterium]|nr:MBL fold metallo-hydrolase [Spirochaetota bacterium]
MKTRITVICDNIVYKPLKLIGEHGLSLLIESNDITLFDTGQGLGIINNFKALGKDISSINRIILSHAHYDHTGGLMNILKAYHGRLSVYANTSIFMDKIAEFDGPEEKINVPIGMPCKKEQYEKEGAEFQLINNFIKINNNISAISNIKREPGWKSWDAKLKQRENDLLVDDPFNDDLSLLIETDSGPIVLLGCAHAGIVEILNNLKDVTGYKEFHAVIGGTHLGNASDFYIDKAMKALKDYNIKIIGTSHCTGFRVSCIFSSFFNDSFYNASVGSVFEF